ncbi:MAG: hypothetical protein ABSF26_22320 [Thermoguttaceae bacterium]
MTSISATGAVHSASKVGRLPKVWVRRVAAAATIAAGLLVAVSLLFHGGPDRQGPAGISASSLLSQACAAEEKFFAGEQVIHLTNTIIVKPVSDATLARIRWLPLLSLEATGKMRFNQLTLAAEVGKGYTVEDKSWYDPKTGRFVRVLRSAAAPIFANSYDGQQISLLEAAAKGGLKVVRRPAGKDFRPPKSPAELLGLAAGLRSGLDAKQNEGLAEDKGSLTLEDGSKGRLVKLGFPAGGPKEADAAFFLVTIRAADNTIEKMEFLAHGASLFEVRRGNSETAVAPEVGWDLAGLKLPGGAGQKLSAGIVADMVIPNISIKHMIEKADYKTYIFAKDPPWAGNREITDILDLPSPPHRMFAASYRAKDGRHVVLLQSYSYNKMLAPLVKMGKLVYTSPGGVKVWSGPRDAWLAQILLQSARAAIHDPPGKNPTGYLLQTPEGTFPALAVNGQLTEKELHALIDSLVPASQTADSGK